MLVLVLVGSWLAGQARLDRTANKSVCVPAPWLEAHLATWLL